MNIDDLSVGQAKQLVALFSAPQASASPFDALIGKNVMIRTVTMILVGRLVAVYSRELAITDASWIADTKRWQQFIATGAVNECEPYPDNQMVIIGRGALIDATEWLAPLPRRQQ